MGLIQAFDYPQRQPNAAQVALQRVAATPWGAWSFSRTLHHIDRVLLRVTRGQVTVPGVVTGLPIITITTGAAGWPHDHERKVLPPRYKPFAVTLSGARQRG